MTCVGARLRSVRGMEGAGVRTEKAGREAGIPPQIMAIRFGLGILLVLNFNGDEFLCVFFRCIMIGGSQKKYSIILIGPL